MEGYKTRARKIPGTRWADVASVARGVYKKIEAETKRRPYVRSVYFGKQKIFLGIFWHHLHEKLSIKQKTQRLKFFVCAIELIQKTHLEPVIKKESEDKNEILYRFLGITSEGERFFVQIKENRSSHEKMFISVFPENA